jgi:drug/metabolite transporter (DMT)-like permease
VRLALLGAIWGSSYLFIKVALRDFSPLIIVGGRILIGAAVLLAVLAVRRLHFPGREVWGLLVMMAIIAQIVPFLLITWGEESVTSALAAILNSTTPLFTVVIGLIALKEERSGPLRLAGIALGFAGVAIIVGIGEGASDLAGDLAIVLSSLCYAIGFVFARKRLTGLGYSSLELSTGQQVISLVLMTPLLAGQWFVNGPSFTVAGTLCVLVLGAFGTGFAYILSYRLIQDTGATSASMVTYLIPVFGATLGWIFLNETLGLSAIAGAAMVVAGILIAERARRTTSPVVVEPADGRRPDPGRRSTSEADL